MTSNSIDQSFKVGSGKIGVGLKIETNTLSFKDRPFPVQASPTATLSRPF